MIQRRQLVFVHRWTALTLGLVVLLSALTGAGMAFRKQLEPIVYPRQSLSSCSTPINLDQILREAEMTHPGGRVDYLREDWKPGSPIAVRYLNKDTLYFDRCTGQVLASQNRYGGFFGTLEWLHRGQWISFGGNIMGAGATCLLLLLVGLGLYLWWPRNSRRFVDALKLNRKLKRGAAFDMGLHRTVGAWVAIPLTISALTALPNAFPAIQDAMIAMGANEVKTFHPKAAGPMLPLASVWTIINRLSPSPQQVLIHLPSEPASAMEIFIIAADAPHSNARTYLYLDPHNGRVLSYTPYADMGWGGKLYYWILSIHTGEVGGILGQLVLFLGATGALVLGYTGIRTWADRSLKRKTKSKGPPEGSVTANLPPGQQRSTARRTGQRKDPLARGEVH